MNIYLQPKEIAAELNISVQTVWNWCKAGQLPYTKFNRAIRIKRKDYDSFLEERSI